MSNSLFYSYSIPWQAREGVATVIDRNVGLACGSMPRPDLEYLFEIWNYYICKYEEDYEQITCFACISKVFSKLRSWVQLWKEEGFYNDCPNNQKPIK